MESSNLSISTSWRWNTIGEVAMFYLLIPCEKVHLISNKIDISFIQQPSALSNQYSPNDEVRVDRCYLSTIGLLSGFAGIRQDIFSM